MIYLDNAATTKVAPEVLEAMQPWFSEHYGNAGSVHKFGREAAAAIAKARGHVAELIGCTPDHIVFTSGGTEGNNLVVRGIRSHLESIGKKHLILSSVEHESLLRAAESLLELGFDITFVDPDYNGHITFDAVKNMVRKDTGFISIMKTNNETGATNDYLDELAEFCECEGILLHTDMVQAVGHEAIDVSRTRVDFITISSHKIHGPKGIGAVYVKDKTVLDPLILGGLSQEFGLRGGTENVPGIVGFGEACRIAKEEFVENRIKVAQLKNEFVRTLIDELPGEVLRDKGIVFNANSHLHSGRVLSIRVDGVFGETLVLMLDAMGVYISAGSACNSYEDKPSRVLLAHGLTEDEARCSVRISFSKYNTEEEVVSAASAIAGCITTLRNSGLLGEEGLDGN